MRTCLLVLSLVSFISCGKKTNEIDSFRKSQAFSAEKSLVIPHGENGSLLRPKLLNKIVESKFSNSETNPKQIIQIHDELQNIELTETELKDYEIKEKILTKVVVSFSDREEVYFVQERIPVQELILRLRLTPEENRKFAIVPSPYDKSFIGASFYIVSLNYEDLMKNDQYFYSEESTLNNFQEKIYFENYKSVLIKVDYDFKVQSLVPSTYVPRATRCTKNTEEGGTCGEGCSFTTNLPVNSFESSIPKSLQDIGLAIKYNDSFVQFDRLDIQNSRKGYFEIKLNSADILDDNFTFQFIKLPSTPYSGTSAHYNFSRECNGSDRSKVSPYGQSTQVNMNIKMLIFGRGEKLKEIIL